jgi:hypothetical protein
LRQSAIGGGYKVEPLIKENNGEPGLRRGAGRIAAIGLYGIYKSRMSKSCQSLIIYLLVIAIPHNPHTNTKGVTGNFTS